jgi:glycosyltransferase involved in cell wall biosynthesis
MKLLLLTTDIYGGYGGIALYNRDFAAALTEHPDCEELVVVPRLLPNPPEEIPAKVRFVAEAARNNIAYFRAVRALRRERFDLVFCGHVNLLPVARMMSDRPTLLVYGIEAWKPPRDRLRNRLARNAGAVISISDITLSRFVSWSSFGGRTFVLPNAIHLDEYAIGPRDPNLVTRYGLAGKRVLLTVGRIVAAERYKGFDEVIEVLPDLPKDVAYLIAGGGNDLPRLRRKVDDLGLFDRVIFTGLFPEAEKPALYNLADVYVMPSRGEGFGFVLLEAMACGVPAIGSRHDGGREALRGGQLGILVDPASAADLRLAITELLGRREKRIPAGLDYFSFDNFRARVHAIVNELRR